MKATVTSVLALALCGVFALLWWQERSAGNIHERDAELVQEVARNVQAAEEANAAMEVALEHAAEMQHAASAEREKARRLERESTALKRALDHAKKKRPKRAPAETLEECNQELDNLESECVEHATTLAKAFDLQKATTDALRGALENSQQETASERTARILSEERAEVWKKDAKKQRRQKILIGVGAGVGGVLLAWGTARAVQEAGD